MPIEPLPEVLVEPAVRLALLEGLGRAGDIPSNAVVPADLTLSAALVARRDGVVAGLDAAILAFRLLQADVAISVARQDGDPVAAGGTIATVRGRARTILAAERVALNFLCHLSGIATATAALVAAIAPSPARIVCTRKTLPGLRALQKHAILAGGGMNHRFGLDDAMLIKDNHVAAAGGVTEAIRRAKSRAGHLVKIQVEVDDLDQLDEVLREGVDAVLLDNMGPDRLAEAVRRVGGRAVTEASGGITPDNARAVAASGVDLISLGWLTHSNRALDIGLDVPASAG